MEYRCHLIPMDQFVMTGSGIKDPLCNDCRAPDCSNPIRDRLISIMGVNKKMRVWIAHNQARQVVECEGYMGDQDVEMGSIEGPTEEL